VIRLKGFTLDELGLILEEGGPDVGGLALERETIAWAGRAGVVPAAYATVAPRRLRFVLSAEPATVAERLALIDWLKDLLMTGPIDVEYDDAPARVVTGTARVFDASVLSPSFVNLEPRITVEIDCYTANKWDREALAAVIGPTPVPIPCGTLAHGGQVRFTGPHSGLLRLTARGLTGEIVGDLQLTIPATGTTLAEHDTLLVDLDAQELVRTRASDGAVLPVPQWQSGGDFFECAAGHRPLNVWGTLEATIAGLYQWRRTYQ
jgi:hypothetical protein